MGEVYVALDTRLDRQVAIKVLPEHLSQNEELRQRFEREARADASVHRFAGREAVLHARLSECLEG